MLLFPKPSLQLSGCSSQTAAALIAIGKCERDGGGDAHVWGMPHDALLLRSGIARFCDEPSRGSPEVIFHRDPVKLDLLWEHWYFCEHCGASNFPEG